ncbi:MAG: hypothetical protein AAGA90_13755 [Actinomycetota bacterium]
MSGDSPPSSATRSARTEELRWREAQLDALAALPVSADATPGSTEDSHGEASGPFGVVTRF